MGDIINRKQINSRKKFINCDGNFGGTLTKLQNYGAELKTFSFTVICFQYKKCFIQRGDI